MGDNVAEMLERLKIDPRPDPPLEEYTGSQEHLPNGPSGSRRLRPRAGFVYLLLQDSDECDTEGNPAHFYKLGGSRNPHKRRQDLQTGNPHRLVAKKCYEVSRYKPAESSAREAVTRWKVKLGGGTEWLFVPDNEKEEMYGLLEQNLRQFRIGNGSSSSSSSSSRKRYCFPSDLPIEI